MRTPKIALIAAAAVVLAACGTSQAARPNITVNNPGAEQNGISVSGMGEVTGAPDTVEVDLGVSVLAETVEEATAAAAEKAEALISSLTGNGVEERDITTTNYSIHPEYDYSNGSDRLIGYRVNNTVRAKIGNIAATGSVIDDATSAAGDDVRVDGLRFSIEDDAGMIEAAREAAWQDAMAKAEQLASLSGQTLGAAVSINETVSRPPTPIFFEDDAAAAAERVETPIEPGTSAVTITLQVNFALEG